MSPERRSTASQIPDNYPSTTSEMGSLGPKSPYAGDFHGRSRTPVSPELGSETTEHQWYNDFTPAILPISIKRTTSLHYLLFGKGAEYRSLCEQPLDPFFLPLIPNPESEELGDPANYHKIEKSETKWLDLTKAPKWTAGYTAELPGLGGAKMLVPRDWEKAYDYIASSGQEAMASGMGIGAHVAIRGGSGIGKRSCLDYILFRRLLEGKPVVWRASKGDFLFSKEGCVFWKKEDTLDWLEKAEMEFVERGGEVWFIIADDSDVKEWEDGYKCLRVIGAGEKWEKWVKERNMECIWMDAWSWEEFFHLKNLYQFPIKTAAGTLEEDQFIRRLWKMYYRFGGEPLLFKKLRPYLPGDQFEKNLLDYQAVVERACRRMAQANIGPNSQNWNQDINVATDFCSATRISYEDEVVALGPASGSNPDLGGKREIYMGLNHTPRLRTGFIANLYNVQRLTSSIY